MKNTSDNKVKTLVLQGLEQDRQRLLMRQPFIGIVLMHLELIPVIDSCLATAATDGRAVYMNCRFYAALDLDERLFVLAHEAWHCVFLHFARLQNRDRRRFNIATDLEIHFALLSEKMKEPFVLPHNPDWSDLSAEEIYEELKHWQSKKNWDSGQHSEHIENTCGEGFDTHIYQRGNSGECEDSNSEEDSGEDGDPDFSPVVDKNTKEHVRRIVIQAAQQVERTQGCLPRHLQNIIEKLWKPELNWRELLKQFVSSAYGGSRRWLPPARRYIGLELYLQSRRSKRLNAVLAIDTSGSTTDDLHQFFAELAGLLNSFDNYELTVIQCDYIIQKVENFSSDRPLPRDYQWRSFGHGGTCFKPPFAYIKNFKLCPDVFIYLTDGCGDAPEKAPYFPVLWVLTSDGKIPTAWGKKIYLKGNN